MQPIQSWQLKKIYAIAGAMGMVGRGRDDDLHVLAAALTGRESIKALTFGEAGAVIQELEKRQGAGAGRRGKAAKAEARPGGITAAQQSKVWALVGELEKWDREPSRASHRQRLCGAIKHILGMDASPASPFRWLTMEQGIRLINGLKQYAEHAEKKSLREGGSRYG